MEDRQTALFTGKPETGPLPFPLLPSFLGPQGCRPHPPPAPGPSFPSTEIKGPKPFLSFDSNTHSFFREKRHIPSPGVGYMKENLPPDLRTQLGQHHSDPITAPSTNSACPSWPGHVPAAPRPHGLHTAHGFHCQTSRVSQQPNKIRQGRNCEPGFCQDEERGQGMRSDLPRVAWRATAVPGQDPKCLGLSGLLSKQPPPNNCPIL